MFLLPDFSVFTDLAAATKNERATTSTTTFIVKDNLLVIQDLKQYQ